MILSRGYWYMAALEVTPKLTKSAGIHAHGFSRRTFGTAQLRASVLTAPYWSSTPASAGLMISPVSRVLPPPAMPWQRGVARWPARTCLFPQAAPRSSTRVSRRAGAAASPRACAGARKESRRSDRPDQGHSDALASAERRRSGSRCRVSSPVAIAGELNLPPTRPAVRVMCRPDLCLITQVSSQKRGRVHVGRVHGHGGR